MKCKNKAIINKKKMFYDFSLVVCSQKQNKKDLKQKQKHTR